MSDNELEIQDRTLLKRAIYEKDQYAQKYIYLKYKPAVRQFIKNAGKLDGYIDDLAHEVFVNICEGKCQDFFLTYWVTFFCIFLQKGEKLNEKMRQEFIFIYFFAILLNF